MSEKYLGTFIEMGLHIIKIGEEARVHLPDFSLAGGKKQDLRTSKNKLEKLGYTFKYIEKSEVPKYLPKFREISDEWLKNKNGSEKGFSLGKFDEEYISRFPCGCVVSPEGEILAFTNLWSVIDKSEISCDIMRYNNTAPNGVMEYLFTELILWSQQAGYQWFNFGMAPLAGMRTGEYNPLWNKTAGTIYKYGENFYKFRGLRAYKQKFGPKWEPKYLVCEKSFHVPIILKDTATLISGGMKGIFKK